MDTTASSFTLRKNARRAADAMIRKGTAPAIDYVIKSSDNGRFEIVWETAKTAPTTDEVETEIAEASADQPAAALPTEAASQPAPAATEPPTVDAAPQPVSEVEAASQPAPVATEPAPALNEPAPKGDWPNGTRVMVRKRKSWREATIISRLDPDHWRAEYPGGGSGMFREADIRAYDPKRDATPAEQPRHAKATAPQSRRSRDIASTPRQSPPGGTPLIVALAMTTLLPSFPMLRDLDAALLRIFQTLSESESKQLLAAWGVGSAREHRANSAEAAVETAEQLGFPVALKVDSPDIPHKTEAGVVRLNLGDAAQVRAAYAEILASAKAYLSALPLDGGGLGGGDRAGGNPFGHRAANSPPPPPPPPPR